MLSLVDGRFGPISPYYCREEHNGGYRRLFPSTTVGGNIRGVTAASESYVNLF